MHSCKNNHELSYTEKTTKHASSCYSFLQIVHLMQQNKLDRYIGGDCMERFCKDLKDHAMKIINYEEKKMIPLTDKENKSYEEQKVCCI